MATATTRYPYGYGSTTETLAQLMRRNTVNRLHPEFRRRVFAMMEAAADAGVPLGIGTGWRVQPNPPPPGFAKPGNSNHESFPAGSNAPNAVAADMVPTPSFDWMERNCHRFGLRTFRHVNNEPWHIQPVEIPAGRNWRKEPWSLPAWPLTREPSIGGAELPTPPPPLSKGLTVELPFEELTVATHRNRRSQYTANVQALLNLRAGQVVVAEDGYYGPKTEAVVKLVQGEEGLKVDGRCGPKTLKALWDGRG